MSRSDLADAWNGNGQNKKNKQEFSHNSFSRQIMLKIFSNG
jgi:hypothetical protein